MIVVAVRLQAGHRQGQCQSGATLRTRVEYTRACDAGASCDSRHERVHARRILRLAPARDPEVAGPVEGDTEWLPRLRSDGARVHTVRAEVVAGDVVVVDGPDRGWRDRDRQGLDPDLLDQDRLAGARVELHEAVGEDALRAGRVGEDRGPGRGSCQEDDAGEHELPAARTER